jgi:hypothetical protein
MNKDQFSLLPTLVDRLTKKEISIVKETEDVDSNLLPFTKKDRIIFVGVAGTYGYSILTKETIINLRNKGYKVNYLAYNGRDPDDVIYKSVHQQQFDDKDATCYVINLPPFVIESVCIDFIKNRTDKQKIYAFSLWDSNYIKPEYVDQLNKYCDAVIVCSEWNQSTFIECGVTKDIYTLIYDPIIPVLPERSESIEFVKNAALCFGKVSNLSETINYYTIGQWTQRKGITETIETFCKAFQNNENVSLIVKTYYNGYSENDINVCKTRIQEIVSKYPNCPSVYYIWSHLSSDEIFKIHASGDIYLSLTKSEGIGLGPLIAAKYKRPVVITSYGAQKEYLKNFSNIYFVNYELFQAQDDLQFGMDLNNQLWAHGNIDQAVEFSLGIFNKMKVTDDNPSVILDSNVIFFDGGWYDVEKNDTNYFKWCGPMANLMVRNDQKFDRMVITSKNQFTKKNIVVRTKTEQNPTYETVSDKVYEVDDVISVNVPLTDVVAIKIHSDYYQPSEFKGDVRKLSLSVSEFSFYKNDQLYTQPIEMVRDLKRKENVILKNDVLTVNTNEYYKHNSVVGNLHALDDVTVVLTCHGSRVNFGKTAYQSIVESGIKNVSIVISGNDADYVKWGEELRSKHRVTIITEDLNNNQCWLEGVKAVTTKWSVILHDDDLMLPSISNELQYLNDDYAFGIWDGNVVDYKTNRVIGDNTVKLGGDRRIVSVKFVRELIDQYPLTISPIHGVFPTHKLIECLTNWEATHGSDKNYYTKPTFVVGNDLFIWLYFTQNVNDVCFVTPVKCTSCVAHNTSATVEDLTTNNRFINLYSSLKHTYIKRSLKSAILLYLPVLESKHLKCLDNLRDFHLSKNNTDIIVYSDSNLEIPNKYRVKFIRTPSIPKMTKSIWSVSDKYSYWAFMDGLKIARDMNLDYFFGYEWDCKVGKDYWYDTLWQEHLSWKKEPIVTGTPVFKHPFETCGNIYMGSLDYRYHYSKECKLHMVVEHIGPPCLYTNGALTFYDVKKTLKYFDLELNSKIVDKSSHVDQTGPWDLQLGIRIVEDLKEKSFDHVGWLPSSYSGCGEYFYTQKQRDYMLNSGMKVVIHQNKYK